jgi:nucleotide-binding universal stress UspA family protein
MAGDRTFVVPLDGSELAERAVPVAAALARHVGGGLILLTAVRAGPDQPQPYLDKLAGTVHGVPVEPMVVYDRDAVGAIRLTAAEDDRRVVCMTSHGRGGLRWAVLGSVAEEIVRATPGPVLVVGRHCARDWRPTGEHLLLCVDGSERSAGIAADVWPWADLLGLDLDAAIVIHPLDVESAERPDALVAPITTRLRRGDRTPHVAVLRGSFTAGALADHADALPATLVAMASHGRTGFARLALGSVTTGVVNLARCPVLVEGVR